LQAKLSADYAVIPHYYLEFSPLQRKIGQLMGIPGPPLYFAVLLEYRKRPAGAA